MSDDDEDEHPETLLLTVREMRNILAALSALVAQFVSEGIWHGRAELLLAVEKIDDATPNELKAILAMPATTAGRYGKSPGPSDALTTENGSPSAHPERGDVPKAVVVSTRGFSGLTRFASAHTR